MGDLEQKVLDTIGQYDMIPAGTIVTVGISGGADSVCLLLLLQELQHRGYLQLRLRALHVHHGLRASAEEDLRFVEELCARRQIPLCIRRTDAAAEARRRGTGIEEAGRLLRREFYREETAAQDGQVRIALAHHAEDCAETLLFNLCRGSSLTGLSGIRPVSRQQEETWTQEPAGEQAVGEPSFRTPGGLTLIRPLLRCTRPEIEEWLSERGQSFRVDETNNDNAYTRNYLRNIIIPQLEDRVNAASVGHMVRLAGELSESSDYLEQEAGRALDSCREKEFPADGEADGTAYRISALEALPPFLLRKALYLALSETAGHRKDIGAAHVDALQRLLRTGGSASLDLPCGVKVRREYDLLIFRGGCRAQRSGLSVDAGGNSSSGMPCGGASDGGKMYDGRPLLPLSEREYEVRRLQRAAVCPAEDPFTDSFPGSCADFSTVPCTDPSMDSSADCHADPYTKWFDCDKMPSPVTLRTCRTGDRIAIGGGRHKRLSREMIDQKIPSRLRGCIVLPAAGCDVLWIPGVRVSTEYRVDEGTRQILEIRWRGPDGRNTAGGDDEGENSCGTGRDG